MSWLWSPAKVRKVLYPSSVVGSISPAKLIMAAIIGFPLTGCMLLFKRWLALRRIDIEGKTISDEDLNGRNICYTWHQNTYLTWLLAKEVPVFRKCLGITHDRLYSLAITYPAALTGFKMFVFRIKHQVSPTKQLSEAFHHTQNIILLPDSGGPYFEIRPGMLLVARKSAANLVPLAFFVSRGLELGKEKRHRIPLPRSTTYYALGKPLEFDDKSSDEKKRFMCQKALEDLSESLKQRIEGL